MYFETCCPECYFVFEMEKDLCEIGGCPNCGKEYVIDFDCDDEHDAVTIVDWFSI